MEQFSIGYLYLYLQEVVVILNGSLTGQWTRKLKKGATSISKAILYKVASPDKVLCKQKQQQKGRLGFLNHACLNWKCEQKIYRAKELNAHWEWRWQTVTTYAPKFSFVQERHRNHVFGIFSGHANNRFPVLKPNDRFSMETLSVNWYVIIWS